MSAKLKARRSAADAPRSRSGAVFSKYHGGVLQTSDSSPRLRRADASTRVIFICREQLRAPQLDGRCAPLRLGSRVVRGRLLRRRSAGGATAWGGAARHTESAHRPRTAPPLTREGAPRACPPRCRTTDKKETPGAAKQGICAGTALAAAFLAVPPSSLRALPPWTRRRSGAWACCAATWLRRFPPAALWLSRQPRRRAWARTGPSRAASAWRFRSACPATSTSTGAQAQLPRQHAQLRSRQRLG